MALQGEPVGARLFLDPGVDLQVAELRDGAACPADQVMMVPAFRELIAGRPVLKRYAADQFQFLQELNRPEHRRSTNRREFGQEVLDREWPRGVLDGGEHRPPRRRRAKTDRFQALRCRLGEAHALIVTKCLTR